MILLDRKEAWKEICKKTWGKDYFFPRTDEEKLEAGMELCEKMMGEYKTKIITEEQIKQHYNVYVYQILPYPPKTKDEKKDIKL